MKAKMVYKINFTIWRKCHFFRAEGGGGEYGLDQYTV
jgi:hypothetical protein